MAPHQMTIEQLADVFGYQLKRRRLSNVEAAELRNVKPNTQEHERVKGTGPRYFKDGKKVTYSERDILEWMLAGSRRSTAENHREAQAA